MAKRRAFQFGGGGGSTELSLVHPEAVIDMDFARGKYFGATPSQLVVSRAMSALALNGGGSYSTFPINTARITNLGLLVEEARTNLLLQSSGFDTSWVAGTGGDVTVTSSSGVSPVGTNDAVSLDDTSSVATGGRRQLVTVASSSSVYTGSVFLKAGTSSVASLVIGLANGTSVTGEAVIDLTNGAAQWRSGVSGTTLHPVLSLGNGWYRLAVSITDNATGNTALRMEIRPAFGTTYAATGSVTATGNVLAWGAQLSQAAFPLSPILTTSTALTRPADNIYLPISGIGTECTVFADVDGIAGNSQSFANIFTLSADGTNNNRLSSNRANALSGGIQASNVVSGVSSSIALTAATVGNNVAFKTASRYSASSIGVSLNGNTVATVSVSSAPSVSRIYFGNRPTGDNGMNGYIKRIAIIPRAMSDAELQAITT